MNTSDMIECLRAESNGFIAGQRSERERIEELIHLRQEELKSLLTNGTPASVQRTARAAIAELGHFLNQLNEAG